MSEERVGYVYDRVLIDAARMLDPQFDPVTLTATGAQVEMLRNVAQYLMRHTTYAAEIHGGYYITPTAEDFDVIQAMVADLQDKLMNGGVSVADFTDRYSEWLGTTMTADEDFEATSTPVPAGSILIVERVHLMIAAGNRGDNEFKVDDGANEYYLDFNFGTAEEVVYSWEGSLTLKEGDKIYMSVEDCLDGDVIEAGVWGYTFEAP